MAYKFEQLNVWNDALAYTDLIYQIAESLPKSEEYNLKSQIIRAATSVALNIAEGSTGQSNAEQARYFGLANSLLLELIRNIKNCFVEKSPAVCGPWSAILPT